MQARHCVVAPFDPAATADEWLKPIRTHCLGLATWLQSQHQQVTLLYAVGDVTPGDGSPLPGLAGVEQCFLPNPEGTHPHLPPCADLELSVRVSNFLGSREFDFIHFQDWKGAGFVALQRRRTLGLPGEPVITSTVHGGTEREMECRGTFPAGTMGHLISCHGERWSVLHADVAILANADLKTWGQQHAWEFPPTRVTLPLFGSGNEGGTVWAQWLQELPGLRSRSDVPATPAGTPPALTVCMAHHNHGAYLAAALASLAAQTFADFTVIVVDDGSTDADSIATFDSLESQYQHRGWQFIRSINRGASGARNHAAGLAETSHMVFMDSDNVARPEMLEVLGKAVHRSGADALSCHFLLFDGDIPSPAASWFAEYHAVGPCLEAGFLTNVYGDTNFIIRTEVFQKLGGFREISGFSLEDWEFLGRLVQSGYDLDVVPKSLFYYRHLPDSFSRRGDFHTNHLRVIQPVMGDSPFWVKRALLGWFGSEGPGGESTRQELLQLQEKIAQLSTEVERLQQARLEDKVRLKAAKEKVSRLREKLLTQQVKASKFGQKLRRLFFPGK
ncbi:glycosyltransferase [Verrucomicrobium sp. BvORR034]|uniref:glycosyltransferase n=1 Tax=Verrucomicrobium sp. BvORR034 TaxID=1396418 RepID=UPI0006797591|nr:glycosyltransferase [Verrucomicrobium sp. BvORR034]